MKTGRQVILAFWLERNYLWSMHAFNHRPASDPFMLSGLATRSILGVWLVVGWDHVKFRSNVLYWPVLLVLVLIHAWLIENILLLLLLLIWLLRHAYFREYTYKVNHLNYKEEYYNGDSNEMWEYTLTKSVNNGRNYN